MHIFNKAFRVLKTQKGQWRFDGARNSEGPENKASNPQKKQFFPPLKTQKGGPGWP